MELYHSPQSPQAPSYGARGTVGRGLAIEGAMIEGNECRPLLIAGLHLYHLTGCIWHSECGPVSQGWPCALKPMAAAWVSAAITICKSGRWVAARWPSGVSLGHAASFLCLNPTCQASVRHSRLTRDSITSRVKAESSPVAP